MARNPNLSRPAPLFSLVTLLAASLLVPSGPVQAESEGQKSDESEVQATAQVASPPPLRLPLYQPPKVGKPARTVGGGSRGPGDGMADLYVLVPDHVGRTEADQPTLFWYIDAAPKGIARIEFTLLDEDGIDPLVQTTLEIPKSAGIQRIPLADHGVKLQPGIEYEWSVALVVDANDRAKDVVSSGYIDRIETSGAVAGADVYQLAEQGLWYDALNAIDEQIRARPGDEQLTQMRAALLRQVGLDAVADATL